MTYVALFKNVKVALSRVLSHDDLNTFVGRVLVMQIHLVLAVILGTMLLACSSETGPTSQDDLPEMRLGSVLWELPTSGQLFLSDDGTTVVVGGFYDSTIYVVNAATGQVRTTLPEKYRAGSNQEGFTDLAVSEDGTRVFVSQHDLVNGDRWSLYDGQTGERLLSDSAYISVKYISVGHDRIVFTRLTGELRTWLYRLSDFTEIATIPAWGTVYTDYAAGRVYITDRYGRLASYDLLDGRELQFWGVTAQNVNIRPKESPWLYSITSFASMDQRGTNHVTAINTETGQRRQFRSFMGEMPELLMFHPRSSFAEDGESAFISGYMGNPHPQLIWKFNAEDSTAKLWLDLRFEYDGELVPHISVLDPRNLRFIHCLYSYRGKVVCNSLQRY